MLYSRVLCMPKIAGTKYLLTMCTVSGDFVRADIFTDEELRQISRQARRLGPPGSLPPCTFDTLFSLIAATGMRPSEAAIFASPIFPPRESSCARRSSERAGSSPAPELSGLPRRLPGASAASALCRRSLFYLDERSRFIERRVKKFFGRYLRRAEYQRGPSRARLD